MVHCMFCTVWYGILHVWYVRLQVWRDVLLYNACDIWGGIVSLMYGTVWYSRLHVLYGILHV